MAKRDVNVKLKATDEASPLVDQAALRMERSLKRTADAITMGVMTPTERYQRELRELRIHLDAGRISQETYGRAMRQQRTELDQTTNAARRMNREFKGGFFGKLSSGGGALLGGLGLGGLTGAASLTALSISLKSSMSDLDALAKQATKLGVLPEELQLAQYAAERTGVATETLNMAMQRFTRRTAEAARGTGEAKNALAEMRLDADKLMRMPLREQMLQLADAFAAVPEEADRVRLAMKLFDSEGVAMVNTFQDGREALDAMFQRREGLGTLFDSEQLSRVVEANDAWADATLIFKDAVTRLAVEAAPLFKAGADALLQASQGPRDRVDRLGKTPTQAEIDAERKRLNADPGVMFGGELLPFENVIRQEQLDQLEKSLKLEGDRGGDQKLMEQLAKQRQHLDLSTSRRDALASQYGVNEGGSLNTFMNSSEFREFDSLRFAIPSLEEKVARLESKLPQSMTMTPAELAEARSAREREANRAAMPRPPVPGPGSPFTDRLASGLGAFGGGPGALAQAAAMLGGVGTTFDQELRGAKPGLLGATELAEARVKAAQLDRREREAEAERLRLSTRTPAELMAAERSRVGGLFDKGLIDEETRNRGLAAVEKRFAPRESGERSLAPVVSRFLTRGPGSVGPEEKTEKNTAKAAEHLATLTRQTAKLLAANEELLREVGAVAKTEVKILGEFF